MDLPAPSRTADVLGEPRLRLTYSGTGAPAGTHVFAQIVDTAAQPRGRQPGHADPRDARRPDAHDRARRSSRSPCARPPGNALPPSDRVRLERSTAHQRSAGTMNFSQVGLTLPVVDASSRAVLRVGRRVTTCARPAGAAARACGSAAWASASSPPGRGCTTCGASAAAGAGCGRRSGAARSSGRGAGAGRWHARAAAAAPRPYQVARGGQRPPYGRRVVVRGKRSRLRIRGR